MKKILVDTSIWIEYFKGEINVIEKIHNRNHCNFITGPVITELIQGIRTQNEKDRFIMCIKALPKLQISDSDWVTAGNIGNSLRTKGITVPLPDLIIFTLAMKNDCALYTLDKHFIIIKEAIQANVEVF